MHPLERRGSLLSPDHRAALLQVCGVPGGADPGIPSCCEGLSGGPCAFASCSVTAWSCQLPFQTGVEPEAMGSFLPAELGQRVKGAGIPHTAPHREKPRSPASPMCTPVFLAHTPDFPTHARLPHAYPTTSRDSVLAAAQTHNSRLGQAASLPSHVTPLAVLLRVRVVRSAKQTPGPSANS